jgi:Anti-sigma-K factor rskA
MAELPTDGQLASGPRRLIGPLWPPRLAVGAGLVGLIVVAVVLVLVLVLVLGSGPRVVPAHVVGGRGSAELRVARGRGQLIVHGLMPPPPGDVYQVWLEPAHSPPLPTQVLFTVAGSGSIDIKLPGTMSGISEVLVTPEPPGGSLSPTHPPVIVVHLG